MIQPSNQMARRITIHRLWGYIALSCAISTCANQRAEVVDSDICIYGGTAGGVAAAVQATRMGKSAVVAEFSSHLGGMTSGGLGATDIGNKAAIGGISREFYHRVARHYHGEKADDTMWTFEPHVAESIFFVMVNEAKVPVYL